MYRVLLSGELAQPFEDGVDVACVPVEVEQLAEVDPTGDLVVHADRMRANLDASHGLVFSHRLLLALVDSGLGRDEAYRIVQRNALRAWDDERDFRELVTADADVSARLAPADLDSVFDLEASIRHVDVVFERLRALAGKEEAVHV